jgi:hypothetical protein
MDRIKKIKSNIILVRKFILGGSIIATSHEKVESVGYLDGVINLIDQEEESHDKCVHSLKAKMFDMQCEIERLKRYEEVYDIDQRVRLRESEDDNIE